MFCTTGHLLATILISQERASHIVEKNKICVSKYFHCCMNMPCYLLQQVWPHDAVV